MPSLHPLASALPKRAMWFFVLSPPFLAFLFDPQCTKDSGHLGRALTTLTLYTVVTGLAVHVSFDWLHHRTRGLHLGLRVPTLLLANVVVVSAVSLALLPLVTYVYPEADGDQSTILGRTVLVSFGYLGFATFVGYLRQEATRERLRAHEARTRALEARLTALQAQLQPHFLFNSLNVCAGLVHEDPERAEATMDRLAEFLRYALESAEHRLVPLDDEVGAVRSYLEIQRQRFGEKLRYSVESRAPADWSVPPLLLQPLVENAIVHGIRESGGEVRVHVTGDAHRLSVVVENDGRSRPSRRTGTGLGQRSVRERLELLYGEDASVEFHPTANGYRCELSLARA